MKEALTLQPDPPMHRLFFAVSTFAYLLQLPLIAQILTLRCWRSRAP